MEIESSNKWIANTVNFLLEDSIYLRLTPDEVPTSFTQPIIWYKSESKGGFQHVNDDRKLNAAWEAHELQ